MMPRSSSDCRLNWKKRDNFESRSRVSPRNPRHSLTHWCIKKPKSWGSVKNTFICLAWITPTWTFCNMGISSARLFLRMRMARIPTQALRTRTQRTEVEITTRARSSYGSTVSPNTACSITRRRSTGLWAWRLCIMGLVSSALRREPWSFQPASTRPGTKLMKCPSGGLRLSLFVCSRGNVAPFVEMRVKFLHGARKTRPK
mmetsp:Transcript_21916/g.42639  ORF Transcript_21916/g.42639 Transcript_21916/m.42639 type:complete len:201 (+) Transcript_21916:1894-2496(+)